ncbi:AI-2E family transporter [Saliterribacillus persicus]|nr:AI-2E family transporter [Saliterribacillus persicus]
MLIVICFLYLLFLVFPHLMDIFILIIRIISPFIIAAFIAYLLHPLVDFLHRYSIPRTIAILLIYFFFFGGLAWLFYHFTPIIVKQLQDLNENLPAMINSYQVIIQEFYIKTAFLPETFHDKMDEWFLDIENSLTESIRGIFNHMNKWFDFFFILAVIPVLVFYFLKDIEKIQKRALRLFPSKFQKPMRGLASNIDRDLGNYIRGQFIVCFILGLLSYLLLDYFNLNYPLVLGSIIGLTNFIPYFGPILGAIPVVLVAFTTSIKMVGISLIIIITLQIIEGNILSPYIVGKSVHLHPVYIILSLFIGIEVAGLIGLLVAVPLLTIFRVVVRFFFFSNRWQND